MAAWLSFLAEGDEAEDEAAFWRYDSTWEEEDDEEEEEDGGEPEGAEAAGGEEPEDAAEQPVPSWAQGCRQAQVGAGGAGVPPGRERGAEKPSEG